MKILTFAILLPLLVLSGCTATKDSSSAKTLTKKTYDSEFPAGNASDALAAITRSVKKLYSVSSYTTYQYRREDKITAYNLKQGSYKQKAWGIISTNETVSGTATVIGSLKPKVALLTCAHIVTSPDTLISYFEPTAEETAHYIKRISIKRKRKTG